MAKKKKAKKVKKKVKKKAKRVVQKKISDKLKVKEISASLSAVIPLAAFENLRPTFSVSAQPIGKVDVHKAFDYLEGVLHRRMAIIETSSKVGLIEKQNKYIKSRTDEDGVKYPRVTSILDWDKIWHIPEDELQQYGARGKIVHKLIEIYLETGKWVNPTKVPELREDIPVLLGGSLGLSWADCSYEQFFKHHKKRIKINKTGIVIYNKEHLYSGEIDAVGEVDSMKAIIDFKTGDYDMRQLAAYAVCENHVDVLVVCPVGPTDNKCGYMRPVICDDIEGQFHEFLKARAKFRQRFGI